MTWLNPFCFVKVANSPLVNAVPLSDTSISGRPCVANFARRTSIVVRDVVDETGTTSNHLECASTITRKSLPRNGPAWSMPMVALAIPMDAKELGQVTCDEMFIVYGAYSTLSCSYSRYITPSSVRVCPHT